MIDEAEAELLGDLPLQRLKLRIDEFDHLAALDIDQVIVMLLGDGRARYEAAAEEHHDHLIDVESGKVIEFVDAELEALQRKIAEKLGFRLVDHRMELYGVPVDRQG